MNAKFKIFGIIAATLGIGILLGAAGRGALMKDREKKYDRISPSEFFLSHIDEIVRPDSSQRPEVDRIAHHTAERITLLFDHHRMEMSMLLDSMKEELEPILYPGQQERLAQAIRFGSGGEEGKRNIGSMIAFSYEYAEHLQQELGLDSLQTERVMAIIHASHAAFRRTVTLGGSDPETLEKAEHVLFDETSRAIQNVLTDAQKDLFRRKQEPIRRYADEELGEEKNVE